LAVPAQSYNPSITAKTNTLPPKKEQNGDLFGGLFENVLAAPTPSPAPAAEVLKPVAEAPPAPKVEEVPKKTPEETPKERPKEARAEEEAEPVPVPVPVPVPTSPKVPPEFDSASIWICSISSYSSPSDRKRSSSMSISKKLSHP